MTPLHNSSTVTMRRKAAVLALLGVSALFAACGEITVPNYNSPNVDGLLDKPDAASVNTTVVGLLVGSRGTAGGYAQTLGIFGREMYNLDQADARFVLSWLVEPLTPGGFGVDVGWSGTYRQILTAQTILDIVDKVSDLSTLQKEGVKGFTKTMMAQAYIDQLRVRDTFGIVLSVDPTAKTLGDFVTREAGYARAATLLDEAKTHLGAAGATFSFSLTSGYAGFNTPAAFLRVNRGLKARLETYRGQWNDALTALGESFINTTGPTAASLAVGVNHVYTTASGDATNPMFDPAPRALVAHPSYLADAQRRADGSADLRTSKVATSAITVSSQGISSNTRLNLAATNVAPISFIRNEELILIRAEANIGLGNRAAAIADLNIIRTVSGGLPALAADFAGNLLDELLYNRRYSLFGEYGHRWVDARRYNRLATLPKFAASHRIYPLVPIPADECNQRSPQPKGCVQVSGL
jgi:starch-binding outer membrane protein, SusD/RagB family